MKTSEQIAAEVFADLARVSKEKGVSKSAAIGCIAAALETYAELKGAKMCKGLRPEVIAFARVIETRLRLVGDESGWRMMGVFKQAEALRKHLDAIEEELTKAEVPKRIVDLCGDIAATSLVLCDNADGLENAPLIDKDKFSRFYQGGGAEYLAQLFFEAREEVNPSAPGGVPRLWTDASDSQKKTLTTICLNVLDALEEEPD